MQIRKLKDIVCPGCGETFRPRVAVAKYCSLKCQQIYQWNVVREKIIHNIGSHCARNIKRVIIELQGHKCSICGLTEWQGKLAPLVMDHIDGNFENNSMDNLRVVCANCDMQLPTYKKKNMGNGRYSRRLRYQEGKSY